MSNSIVGKIVACIILIVLCFIVGAQAAESAKESAALIVAIVGAIFVLVMGPRCWMLIFLLPAVLTVLPLPGEIIVLIKRNFIAVCVLFYWIIMWGMGYVKIRWRSLWGLDLLVLVSAALMIASYVRNPVSLSMLGVEMDSVGGSVYILAFCVVVFYLAISIIPMEHKQLCKVLKWQMRLTIACSLVLAVMNLAGYNTPQSDVTMGEMLEGGRFFAMAESGSTVVAFIYASHSLGRILLNPVVFFGFMCGWGMIAMSGFRSELIIKLVMVVFMSFVKRELSIVILLGGLVYGGLIVLGSSGVLLKMPFAIQRSLSILPGLEVGEEGSASTDWRVEMWQWAMDSRTGYIKNYVWGDGFAQSKSGMEREMRAQARGEAIRGGSQDFFATQGNWHSGWVTAIHRLGIVGLSVITLFYVYAVFLVCRVCISLRGTPFFVPSLFFLMPIASEPVYFYVSAGTIESYLRSISSMAIAKLLFCVAREQGYIVPFLQRRRYVPQMIAEHGDRLQLHA